MWATLGSLAVLVIVVSAIYCAFRAAGTARTPQGAVGWVVFLASSPWLAVPLYLFLGHHRFKDYRISRLQSQQVVEGLRNFADVHAPDPATVSINLRPFEATAGMGACGGNDFELLIDGEVAFDAIFDAIDTANSYILVQFYIVRDDELGQRLKSALISAAQRGVLVCFMTDAIGSNSLPRRFEEDLREAGVMTVDDDSRRGPKHRFQINYRNHRKTVIVDGTVGFTGGLNVGVEYLGQDLKVGQWRDTFVRFQGPMVQQLQLIFTEDWHWATNEPLLPLLSWESQRSQSDMIGLIAATGPGDESETGAMLFFAAIAAAREKVWIASPYFVPDMDVMTALRHAALRGVDVRILLPENADHYIPWLAAFAYFDDLIKAGVRIYRYTEGFMHQKVILVDDTLAGIGTTNMDNRSFRLNFEAMALFFDARAAVQTKAMLLDDMARCFQLTLHLNEQPVQIRYGAPVARLFAPLL
jgi:cardiolipin synthase A/B